jgi:oligopeptide transport system permease protein
MIMDQYPPEYFQQAPQNSGQGEVITFSPSTYREKVWYRLKENKSAIFALAAIGFLVLMGVLGPLLTPFKYSDQILELRNKPPGYQFYVKILKNEKGNLQIIEVSEKPILPAAGYRVESRRFWFGSDSLGRDLFTRNCYGARISLTLGIATAIIVLVAGTVYGGISGYLGGWVDEIMMRVVEVLSAVPFLLYVILLMVLMEPGLKTIFIAIGAVYWVPMARLVRGQILSLKEQEYIMAARSLGAGMGRLLYRHLIPNAAGPVIAYVVLAIPEAIFTEAWLSFLGLGVAAPVASWGTLVNDGIKGIRSYPWQFFLPAFFVSLTIFSFNVLGEGLKESFDPRLRR